MRRQLSWSADIIPGGALMGVNLGMTLVEFKALLCKENVSSGMNGLVKFDNSPLLKFEESENGFSVLAADISNVSYEWQREVMDIGFDDGRLIYFRVISPIDTRFEYKGKIFGDIGLGEKVECLRKYYSEIIYDDVEEWFYFKNGPIGIRVSATDDFKDNEFNGLINSICIQSHRFLDVMDGA